MGKRRLANIHTEKVEQISQHDPRFSKLVNSDAAPKQIESTSESKGKSKAKANPEEYEYVVASSNRSTLSLNSVWARSNKPGKHFKSIMLHLGTGTFKEVSFHLDREKTVK